MMKVRFRTLLLFTVLGAGFLLQPVSPRPAVAARLTQAANNCLNIQLTIQPVQSNGAAGHIGIVYRLHNEWGQACSLYGYPGAELLDRNFVSLPTTVHRGGFLGSIPETTVRLAPYGNAFFTLVYSDVPVGNRPCQRAASYMMIFAPNDRLPVVTYAAQGGAPIMSCTGDLDVSPVTSTPRYH